VIVTARTAADDTLPARMTLTVVGSIAFDAVETQTDKRDRLLGGAAVHFALASSFLAETRVIGPVGDDFGDEEYAILHARGVITDDIEHVAGGKTFFWAGRYERDVNVRHTLQTDLNVFEHFKPKLSDAAKAADTLFLANIQPELQRTVREQCEGVRFSALDSMNLWIDIAHESLVKTIGMVDCVILNDGEVRQLTDEPNLVRAARRLLDMGPRVVVAKQGEYGSAMFTRDGVFGLPAYPTEDVVDPTGAGDTFAGGFMGCVAAHDGREITDDILRTAMAYGTAMASFNVEAFGTERMQRLTGEEIAARVAELGRISHFAPVPLPQRA
jgi:sugar/nucleoside kinase (ribokinase family)